jgi:hypothetical protein
MWLAARIVLWTVNLVSKPRNGTATDIVGWRTTDDSATVIGFVTDRDNCLRHG